MSNEIQNQILNEMGLGFLDIGYIFIGLAVLIVILIVVIIIQGSKIGKINKKYQKFMQGKDAKSLEKSILNLYDNNRTIEEQVETNRKKIREISKKQMFAFQKFGLIKYNAFRQMGGDLSFCLDRKSVV